MLATQAGLFRMPSRRRVHRDPRVKDFAELVQGTASCGNVNSHTGSFLFTQFASPEHLEAVQVNPPFAAVFFGDFVDPPRLGTAAALDRGLADLHHPGKFIGRQIGWCDCEHSGPSLSFINMFAPNIAGMDSHVNIWTDKSV